MSASPKRKRKKSAPREHKRNLLSYAEAEDESGVSRETWRKWAREKRITIVHLGRCVKIPRAALDEFIQKNTVAAV